MIGNDSPDRQNAAPVQRGTLGIRRKSKWDSRLRRNQSGVQVPYPPLLKNAKNSRFFVENLFNRQRGARPVDD